MSKNASNYLPLLLLFEPKKKDTQTNIVIIEVEMIIKIKLQLR